MQAYPEPTAENLAFWTGGAEAALMIACCDACGLAIHPPQPICRRCLSTQVAPRRAPGTGEILAVTVNRQQWTPDMTVPFMLGVVALDGMPGVRVTARIEGAPERPTIGTRVRVDFEPLGDLWRPFFVPAD
jgi:uncharacterized OB-fold protein